MDKYVVNSNLLQASVTLAQIFVDYLQGYDYNQRLGIGEKIIKFLCGRLGNERDINAALIDFEQHNADCRHECYCCGNCEDVELDTNEPNILDENIQEIIKILKEENNNNEIIEDIFASGEDDNSQDW